MSELNIFQRMALVMTDAPYIKKEGRAPEQAGGYSYVKHDDVTATVRPLFIKHGIGIVCSMVQHNCDKMTQNTRSGERMVLFTTVVLKVSFVNVDSPQDRIEVEIPGYGLDTQDKSVGKAISYAFKYALLKNLAMETGDEDIEGRSVDLAAPPKTPAQRKTPAKGAPKPSDELRKLVHAWADCPAEDVPGAVRLVFEKLELPTDKKKVTLEHVQTAIDWCERCMAEKYTFAEAVARQVQEPVTEADVPI